MAGTTTIVFADFARGDAACAQLLRSEVERRRGQVTKATQRTMLALFDGAYDGVLAAIGMQQSAERAGRNGASTTSELRVGIHTGDVADSDDETLGAAVALTRRLCDSALPGQILASEVVRALVGTRRDVSFGPPHGLPGSDTKESLRVAAVRWDPLPEQPHIRTVVAEDAALIRAGIVRLLASEGFEIVAEADDYDGLVAAVDLHRPDLVITDIRMPPTQTDEGLRAAAHIKAAHPGMAVLVLSQHVETAAAAALLEGQNAGIGYILKERVSELDEFIDVARRVTAGGSVIDPLITEQLLRPQRDDTLATLSEREREVLALMAQGFSNQAISDALFLSAKTVESHVRSIFIKLDLPEHTQGNRRVQAVVRWLEFAQ